MSLGADRLREALGRVVADLGFPAEEIALERPREAAHGDLATNVAMKLGPRLKRAPRAVAQGP